MRSLAKPRRAEEPNARPRCYGSHADDEEAETARLHRHRSTSTTSPLRRTNRRRSPASSTRGRPRAADPPVHRRTGVAPARSRRVRGRALVARRTSTPAAPVSRRRAPSDPRSRPLRSSRSRALALWTELHPSVITHRVTLQSGALLLAPGCVRRTADDNEGSAHDHRDEREHSAGLERGQRRLAARGATPGNQGVRANDPGHEQANGSSEITTILGPDGVCHTRGALRALPGVETRHSRVRDRYRADRPSRRSGRGSRV